MTAITDEAVNYVYEAARLLGLSYCNRFDSEMVRDHRREVIYYIDANVALLLFVWPGRLATTSFGGGEHHNLDYISNIGRVDMAGDVDDEIVEAVLAGEFLFSSVIHRPDRDDGPPAKPGGGAHHRMMTAPHWNELVQKLRDYVPIYPAQGKGEIIAEFERRMRDASSEFRVEKSGEPTLVGDPLQKGEKLTTWAAGFEKTAFMELAMMKRLRDRRLLQPASDLPPDVYHVETAVRRRWEQLFLEVKKPGPLRPDATAVAQIERLNEKAGPRGPIHCLVTGDKHLHEAYYREKLRTSPGDDINSDGVKIPDFESYSDSSFMRRYYLRHPAQFVPTLNQRDMVNGLSSKALFMKVEGAAEAIVASVGCSESEALELGMLSLRNRDATEKRIRNRLSKKSLLAETLDDVRRRWGALSRSTVFVNRTILHRRWYEAMQIGKTEPNAPSANQEEVEKLQIELVDDIQDLSLQAASRDGLRRLRDDIAAQVRTVKGNRFAPERRFEHCLISNFERKITTAPMPDVVGAFQSGNSYLFKQMDRTIVALSKSDAWHGLLYCALLAGYTNDWGKLIWFSERARDALKLRRQAKAGDDICDAYHDALYLTALGRRMRLKPGDFDEADKDLKTLTDYHGPRSGQSRKHSLAHARAQSERGTLYLFEQMRRLRSLKHNMDGAAPLLVEGQIVEARTWLLSARDTIAAFPWPYEADDMAGERRRAIIRLVRLQSSLNLSVLDLLGLESGEAFQGFSTKVSTDDLLDEIEQQQKIWKETLRDTSGVARTETQDPSEEADSASQLPTHVRIDVRVLHLALLVYGSENASPDVVKTLKEEIDRAASKLHLSAATWIDREFVRRMRDLADRLVNPGA